MKKIFYIFLFCTFSMCILSNEHYIISAESGKQGFFSNFLRVINHLIYCEKTHKTPVVNWTKPLFIYYQENEYNNSNNGWEYYFEQVTDYYAPSPYPELLNELTNNPQKEKIKHHFASPDGDCISHHFHHGITKEYRRLINIFIKKYIHIKKPIQKKIDDFYIKYLQNKKTVGIHIRGTDYSRCKIDKIIKALNGFNDYQFFIATDEQALLDILTKKLKRNVIYYNSHRSLDGKPIHYSNYPEKATFGEEILIEACLLSRCDIFLHSLSCVATAVLYLNPELENKFVI